MTSESSSAYCCPWFSRSTNLLIPLHVFVDSNADKPRGENAVRTCSKIIFIVFPRTFSVLHFHLTKADIPDCWKSAALRLAWSMCLEGMGLIFTLLSSLFIFLVVPNSFLIWFWAQKKRTAVFYFPLHAWDCWIIWNWIDINPALPPQLHMLCLYSSWHFNLLCQHYMH